MIVMSITNNNSMMKLLYIPAQKFKKKYRNSKNLLEDQLYLEIANNIEAKSLAKPGNRYVSKNLTHSGSGKI